MEQENLINKIYTDPKNPGGYGGRQRLYKEAHKVDGYVSRKNVDDFLKKNRTYTLFRDCRKKFNRSQIIPAGFLSDLHVDLGDFQSLSRKNKGYRYMLVCVDVLSRRVFTAPVRSKSFLDMKEAFEKVFERMPYLPQQIFSDRGTEFESKDIQAYLEDLGIKKFRAEASHIKSAFAKRMIRTIKEKLYRYFSEKNTTDWITVIPKITNAINNSVCRSTGLRPVDIDEKSARQVWEKIYAPIVRDYGNDTYRREKFNLDDPVRISRSKPIFEKGYHPKFSDEIFKIKEIVKENRDKPLYYRLVDYQNEPIKGRFYKEELLQTTEDTTYRIEKIYRKRNNKGIKELYVKFIGYKDKYWIKESDLV
jgi:transposase InsO family protein